MMHYETRTYFVGILISDGLLKANPNSSNQFVNKTIYNNGK